MEEDKFIIEEQFILRLPSEEASKIREVLRTKPEKLKKLMKITHNSDASQVTLNICKTKLYGTMKKLPTIVESYKTNICNNKSLLYKTADVSHIAACDYEEKPREKLETNHGLCPPLKNVKKKRFRKTMFNTENAVEAETISKELYYLLSTDLEAASSKFEILYEGSHATKRKQYEKSLFGQLSSDSSELSEHST
ncbi:hypothetical protein JTB14_024042 [Gonioctena quinquepunctata]|nr:hypothetical protein JTB14_024042 [Gonioctena quinquepunctata]